jgi:hypothetical protein
MATAEPQTNDNAAPADDLEAAIAEVNASAKDSTPEVGAPAETAPPPDAVPAEKAVEAETAKPAPEDKDDILDEKGPAAFAAIAKREKKQREAHAARLAELKVAEEERKALAEFQEAKRLAARDPLSAIKAIGLSEQQFADLSRELYAHSLGDQAPPEWKAQKQQRTALQEVEERAQKLVDERIAQFTQQMQAERAREQYVTQVRESLPTLAEGTKHFARLVTADPARATDTIFRLAAKHAQEHGEVPDLATIARQYEEALSEELRPFLAEDEAPKQTNRPAAQLKTATLTNRNTATPTKPRSSPKSDEEELEQLIAEANRSIRTR